MIRLLFFSLLLVISVSFGAVIFVCVNMSLVYMGLLYVLYAICLFVSLVIFTFSIVLRAGL